MSILIYHSISLEPFISVIFFYYYFLMNMLVCKDLRSSKSLLQAGWILNHEGRKPSTSNQNVVVMNMSLIDNLFSSLTYPGDNFFSYVMYRVRGCRVQREKELKRRRMEAMRQAKRDRELEVIEWEKDLMREPVHSHMRAMWEVS